jgi:hypothetical protein
VTDIFEQLAAPFPPERVSWRVGSTNKRKWEEAKKQGKEITRRGQPLCYIDARDVMERLDAVMGAQWQTDHIPMHNGTMCCRIGLQIEGDWLWRTDGAGPTGDIDNAAQREMAQKGGYSDAFKRAAVLWGVGRYLYAISAPWIELDEWWGIPKDAYAQLNALLRGEKEQSAYAARKDGEYPRLEKLLREAAKEGVVNGVRYDDYGQALATAWKAEQLAIKKLPKGWRDKITEEKDRLKEELEAVA